MVKRSRSIEQLHDIDGVDFVPDGARSKMARCDRQPPCNAGRYKPFSGMSNYTVSSSGYFVPNVSMGYQSPISCPMGVYCNSYYCSGSGLSVSAGFPCQPGNYCPNGTWYTFSCMAGSFFPSTVMSAPKPCPAGFYCLMYSASMPYGFKLCSAGSYYPPGSVNSWGMSCMAGYLCRAGSPTIMGGILATGVVTGVWGMSSSYGSLGYNPYYPPSVFRNVSVELIDQARPQFPTCSSSRESNVESKKFKCNETQVSASPVVSAAVEASVIQRVEPELITINVQTLSGMLPPISMSAQATVRDLKLRLQTLNADFGVDRQELMIKELAPNDADTCVVLLNHRTLQFYRITGRTNVVLVVLPNPSSKSNLKSGYLDQWKFRRSLERERSAVGPNGTVKCQVTSAQLQQGGSDCIAGHIVPRRSAGKLPIHDENGNVVLDYIHDTKNGILWAEQIERAFSANQVCLMTDAVSDVIFVVLDKDIMGKEIVRVDGTPITFEDVHLEKVHRVGRLSLRLILNHAKFAISQSLSSNSMHPVDAQKVTRLLRAMEAEIPRLEARIADRNAEMYRPDKKLK